jgi:hypothetical protein
LILIGGATEYKQAVLERAGASDPFEFCGDVYCGAKGSDVLFFWATAGFFYFFSRNKKLD